MKKSFLTFILFASLIIIFHSLSVADTLQTITLKDGTQLKGKLTSVKDGIYTIQTFNLGTLTVNENQIVSVSSQLIADQAATASQLVPAQSAQQPQFNKSELAVQAQLLQKQFLADPKIMQEIQNLMNDEEVKTILTDPEVMKAVMSYDPNTIAGNEKIKKLMENPKIKSLMNLIQQNFAASPH